MLSLEAHGDVTRVRLSTRVSRLIGYDVSAYLVRGILVDTGFRHARAELARWLDVARPRGAIVTHHHEDHAGNVGLLAARGMPVLASAATLEALARREAMGLYRRVIWGTMPPLAAAPAALEIAALRLLHTPGHSEDHHIVWDAERETLFSGDLFLGVKVRVARPFERPRALLASLRAALALRPRRMFDAHRGHVPDPASALAAKADWLEATIAVIERRLAEGVPEHIIAREVLGREDGSYYITAGDLSRVNFVRRVREELLPRSS